MKRGFKLNRRFMGRESSRVSDDYVLRDTIARMGIVDPNT